MPFIKNVAYEASAGSGKTFMLVVRYLSLLFQGADPAKILALTFTNKAALEMSQRIIETLEDLPHRGELQEIIHVTEYTKEQILSQRSKVLQNFLASDTKIMTIDSFFTKILRKFSLYVGLMPDFVTYNKQHEQKLLIRFLQEVDVAGEKETLIYLAMDSKKRFGDIFSLLDQLYQKSDEIEHFRYTQQPLVQYKQSAMDALAILQEIITQCPSASATLKKAVDVQDFESLLEKTWVYKDTLEYWVFKKCYTPQMDDALRVIQEAIKAYYQAKEANFFHRLFRLIQLYKKAKEALYKEDSELGFSDVTQLVYTILHRLDDSEFLYFRLDATLEHMLLDEFQDTSIIQYKILQPLINEITSGEGICHNGSFFFVGDVKQSIYRFRGGVSALFAEVARQNNTQILQLTTNYRSKKEVVSFVNNLFIDKIQGYTPQKVHDGADGGYVAVITNDEILEEALAQTQYLIEHGANPNDIAILCATNSDGEAIKDFFDRYGIEVVTETTSLLIHQKEVRAVIEYMKYLYFQEEIYKQNFCALSGARKESIEYFEPHNKSLLRVVKECISKYNLFNGSLHLIRFLDVIQKYQDIEQFLFDYERLDATAAMQELHGVRVLTVHKSKGLEYKHVILVDRLKKKPASKESIIYEYEGIELKNIYLRTAQRQEIDTAYAKALAKEKQLLYEDTLNALYVACTRAKEHLFIIQKTAQSSFEPLDLEDKMYGDLVIKKYPKQQQKQPEPFIYKELYYGTQTQILEHETNKSEEDLKAIHFGLALHYMLEMLETFSIGAIDDAYMMMLNKYGFILDDNEIADIRTRVENLVNNQEFLSLLEDATFTKEQPLKYKNNLRYLDLLIQYDKEHYCVIDYKSSLAYHEEHTKQVRAYMQALHEITDAKVQGYLCYILEDRIELKAV